MILRTTLIATSFAFASIVAADPTANCDALDRGADIAMDGSGIALDGQDLVLSSSGAELIHIDANRNLFVQGRKIVVPAAARPHLDAYVAGFRALGDHAAELGWGGGRVAARAIGGLVDVLFTSTTMDDYDRALEHEGARLELQGDSLCRTVLALQRTERELQQRISAFPSFLAPVNPAL